MIRQGEISPTLVLFRDASVAADVLEGEKSWLVYGDVDAWEAIASCELALDEAWGLVPAVERGDGPLVADMVAEHWLLGMPWRDVAARHGLSIDKVKKMAYGAVKSLDGRS